MSYSRRQLEALGEPFGSCATRVKPNGYGCIYGSGGDGGSEMASGGGSAGYIGGGVGGSPGASVGSLGGDGGAGGAGYIGGGAGGSAGASVGSLGGDMGPAGGGSTGSGSTGGRSGRGGGSTGGGDTWINAGGDTLFTGDVDDIRNYINQLYLDELGRPADEAGLKWWTGKISADGKVSQHELNAWRAAARKAGETLIDPADAAARRAAAAEAARLAALKQQQGNVNNQGGTTPPPGFLGVRPLFTGVRNPFYEGSDTRSDLVNMAYQRLLNRQPDPGGLASYNQEMMRGLTGQGLVSALANSPEFQRTQDFQRAYTSTFRPGYQEFGPSGQYNQPIYLSSYTDYARSPGFIQPQYNTEMMTPQQLGYGFGSFNPFAYGGTNPFADQTAPPASSSGTSGASGSSASTGAATGGRIKDDDGITALLER